jgi:hypothetical protein
MSLTPYIGDCNQRLADLINAANGSNFTLGVDYTLGVPQPYSDSAGRNTLIILTPTDTSLPEQVLHYTRLPLTVLDQLPEGSVSPVTIPQLPFTVHGMLADINAALGISLLAEEVVDAQYTTQQDSYPLQITDDCVGWVPSDYAFPAFFVPVQVTHTDLLTVRNDDANLNNGYDGGSPSEIWALSKTFPVQEDGSIVLLYRYNSTTLAANGTISTAANSGITAVSIESGPSSNDVSNGILMTLGTITDADGLKPAIFCFNSSTGALTQIATPFGVGARNLKFLMVSTSNPYVIETLNGDSIVYKLDSSSLAISSQVTLTGRTITDAVGASAFNIQFLAPTGTASDPSYPGEILNLDTGAMTFSTYYQYTGSIAKIFRDETFRGNFWFIDASTKIAHELSGSPAALTGRTIDMSQMDITQFQVDLMNELFWGADLNGNGYIAMNPNGTRYGVIDSVETPQVIAGSIQPGFVAPQPGLSNALFAQMDLPDTVNGGTGRWIIRVPYEDIRTS